MQVWQQTAGFLRRSEESFSRHYSLPVLRTTIFWFHRGNRFRCGYDDCDFDEFVNGLSEIVADDDAIIILESGNEKLRYVTGCALVITSKDSEYMEIDVLAAERAAEMLKNPNWKTQVSY